MAGSRKRPSASASLARASAGPASAGAAVIASAKSILAQAGSLQGRRIVAGLSGGVDSVVLLHVLHALAPAFGFRLSAVHVNHGLSPNAGDWGRFCRRFCSDLGVPLKVLRVAVTRRKQGPEAAARDARRAAFLKLGAHAVAFGHHLDDQAETVLFNLLRGTGLEGASGMPPLGALGDKILVRPLLWVPRSAIRAYAEGYRLAWIEDESNADEALTRNFIRHRVGPLLASRFPRWRESLARAARHFAAARLDARAMLRAFLKEQGLRAPSEAKLVEMLKQLGSEGAAIPHDGVVLRRYRETIFVAKANAAAPRFKPRAWKGEAKLPLPALGGEMRFRRVRGGGIDSRLLRTQAFQVRLRSGGERLRPDARRPSRTLKNLFQEAGVPPWERERLPLLFCGNDLVWVPGLGVDAKYLSVGRAPGIVPDWRLSSSLL